VKSEEKYTGLVLLQDTRNNGWDAHCRAVEVGARGFVGTGVTALFRHLGLSNKESNTARIDLSRVTSLSFLSFRGLYMEYVR